MKLKEFSERLGLSKTTVSRALGGYPEVNAETRERVLRAAKELNYRPHSSALSLVTGKSKAIGHVITESTKHALMNPVFGDFIAGATETAGRSGYRMVLAVVSDDDELATYRELKATRAVDGVIVHGPRPNDDRLPFLEKLGLPYIIHGPIDAEHQNCSWYAVDDGLAFKRATQFLIELGHQRIALINGPERYKFAINRHLGYRQALQDYDLPYDQDLALSSLLTEGFGHQSAARLLKIENPPTAFLVSSMLCCFGVRRAIEAGGLRLGHEVSVITHDDDLIYMSDDQATPAFTSTRSSVRDAGVRSVELLLALISDPDRRPRQELVRADLVLGKSTGPAP